MKSVLLTGFEAFDNQPVNPSWEVVRQLEGRRIGDGLVAVCQLPCVYGEALRVLEQALERHQPALALAVGQAGGRQRISVERVAINLDDARIPDNQGQQPIDQPVVPGGPAAYFATVPIKAMVQAMRDGGIPAEVSQSAGTFVCNHVMYGLLHRLAQRQRPARGGFIHLPYLPEQAAALPVAAPSMAAQTMLAALQIAIATALSTSQDLSIGGGAIS